jgi:membrane-associated protease RseP (regulator of RpoE activity)
MGDSSSTLTDSGGPAHPPPLEPYFIPPSPPPRPRQPWVRFFILLFLTFLSTTYAHSIWYSIPVLAILGAHEFGHYLACRYYRIDASVPYFLPMPFVISGTLGAFIRIRQPIFRKVELFDIGIAGPIAGFLVAVPLIFIGVYLSNVVPRAEVLVPGASYEFGDPLLVKFAIWLTFGATTDSEILAIHPIGFAGWFGLIITSLNLFPFGQLDGGHISYAVFGPRAMRVSQFTVVALVLLAAFVSLSWIAWAGIMLVMYFFLGPKHPSVYDEDVPLDRGRMWLAIFAVVMFILCFTPTPISVTER